MEENKYQFKGTEGPWHAVQYANYINIQKHPFYSAKDDLLNVEKNPENKAVANGNLAAAAPDLLDACLKTLEEMNTLYEAAKKSADWHNNNMPDVGNTVPYKTPPNKPETMKLLEKAICKALNTNNYDQG